MATITAKADAAGQGVAGAPLTNENIFIKLLKYLGLMILDAFTLILVYGFVYDQAFALAIVLALITIFANVVVFVPSLWPVRWMTPGLMLVTLLAVYPIFSTVTTAFTNYSNVDHPYPKEQAIQQIIKVGGAFIDPDAPVYSYESSGIFKADDGTYALWLTREIDEVVETVFAPAGRPIIPVTDAPEEIPDTFEGYTKVTGADRGAALDIIGTLTYGTGDVIFQVQPRRKVAPSVPKFVFDAATNSILDQSNDTRYFADDSIGFFVREGGNVDRPQDRLTVGYRVFIGFGNFTRFMSDPSLRGPLVSIFAWTIVFAGLSVLTTFALGLGMAMVLNDPIIPARKIIRSVLLIPYAIPGVISIVIWRGMLNQNLGIVNEFLNTNIFWLNDPFWAKFSLVLVNLWLGYPYMMLICSGALQSIPSEVYEASSVDGANPWQKFWQITLPLLLVAVGPLLIGSFTFNFNNYLLITALTGGNPPILGSPIPAGQTDILISYVYKTAFSNQSDYGYASAITIIIFVIVASITLFQYRFTRSLEQVSENV